MGMMAIMHSPSRQLMVSNNTLAPMMINAEETMETSACDTNSLIESASLVRLVSSFSGRHAWSIKALLCRDILSERRVRKSRATRSDV